MRSEKTQWTRRRVLQGAGIVAAGAAWPTRSAQAAVSQVMTRLSTYMSEAAAHAQLPAEVVEKTKHHILDTFAAMVSGVELPPGRVALALRACARRRESGDGGGIEHRCAARSKPRMVNGMLAHSDETDDSHAPSHSHPGCAVVPAALAAGEQFGIDGTRFLRAVALGYDVGTRVTMTLGGLPYQMETTAARTASPATFGAAAAAGCAAGLNAQQMRWVLDYAAQQASGIAAWQRDTEHIEKSLVFAGMPGAQRRHRRAAGPARRHRRRRHFFRRRQFPAGVRARRPIPAVLIDKLGERYEVTRTNIKKWTVGSPIQAPLDALENIRKQPPVRRRTRCRRSWSASPPAKPRR